MNRKQNRPAPGAGGGAAITTNGPGSQISGVVVPTTLPRQRRQVPLLPPNPVTTVVDDTMVTPSIQWWPAALAAGQRLATTETVMDADAIRATGVGEPDKANLWGSLFSTLHRMGVIEKIGAAQSSRRARKGGVNLRWRGTAEFRGHMETDLITRGDPPT